MLLLFLRNKLTSQQVRPQRGLAEPSTGRIQRANPSPRRRHAWPRSGQQANADRIRDRSRGLEDGREPRARANPQALTFRYPNPMRACSLMCRSSRHISCEDTSTQRQSVRNNVLHEHQDVSARNQDYPHPSASRRLGSVSCRP